MFMPLPEFTVTSSWLDGKINFAISFSCFSMPFVIVIFIDIEHGYVWLKPKNDTNL